MEDRNTFPSRIAALPKLQGGLEGFKLAADGCDVLFVEEPAGTSLPSHTHDTDNATLIISGEAIITIDGDERRYGPGTWYTTSAGEPHAVRFDVDTIHVEWRFLPTDG